jgi:hypothetical protein
MPPTRWHRSSRFRFAPSTPTTDPQREFLGAAANLAVGIAGGFALAAVCVGTAVIGCLVVGGAAVGLAAYSAQAVVTGHYDAGQAATQTAVGALGGGLGGLAGSAVNGIRGVIAARVAGEALEAGASAADDATYLLRPGRFATESIPARGSAQTFTASERAAVNKIGYADGCHSCGVKIPGTKSGNFVPDHQPVSALNNPPVPQGLYPQCLSCSREQGLLVARVLNGG